MEQKMETHACRQMGSWDLMRLAGCGSEMEGVEEGGGTDIRGGMLGQAERISGRV